MSSRSLRSLIALCAAAILSAYAPFPQASEQEPVIVFERFGVSIGSGRGNPVYSLSIFADGTVIFDGIERTKELWARTQVPHETVAKWVSEFEAAGVLERRVQSSFPPPADTDDYRLTFTHNGRTNNVRWHGWNTANPMIRTVDSIRTALRVDERWATPATFRNPDDWTIQDAISNSPVILIARVAGPVSEKGHVPVSVERVLKGAAMIASPLSGIRTPAYNPARLYQGWTYLMFLTDAPDGSLRLLTARWHVSADGKRWDYAADELREIEQSLSVTNK